MKRIVLSFLLFLNASSTKLNFVLVVILSPCLLLATPRVGLQVEEDSPDYAFVEPQALILGQGNRGFSIIGEAAETGSSIPSSHYLSHFSEAGNLQYSLALDVAEGPLQVRPHPVDESQFFAATIGVNSISLGMYRASDQTPIYRVQVPQTDQLVTFNGQPQLLPDGKVSLLQNDGSSVRWLLLEQDGSVAVDQVYTTANFADLDVSGDVSRTLSIRALSGSSDYLLFVQETRPVIENFMFRFVSRFTVSRLSATGAMRWSRSFVRSAASTVQVQEEFFSGGEIGYLLWVSDPFGSGDRAELIKLDQNGVIDFSRSFSDLLPPLSVKKASSGDLYLFGRYVNSESQGGIDLTVYQIDSSNGAVKKNRSFDYEDSTDGRIIGATSSHVYFEIRSSTDQSLELDRVDLVRTSLDLEQVSSRQYRADSFENITRAQLGEDGRLLFSVFKKSDGSVQVLGLEGDLSPSVGECLELNENPAMRLVFESRPSSSQNASLEVGGVSASAGGTMVVPVSGLAFSDLRLVVADCGAGGGACLPFSIEKLPNGQLRLVVPTQSDLNYQVLRSPDLESSFQPFDTLTGNGGTQVIPLSLNSEGTEFFKLTASPK